MKIGRDSARKLIALAGLVGLFLAAAFAQQAQASTYTVHECTATQPTVSDLQVEGATTGYTGDNACPAYLQVSSSGPVSDLAAKAYTLTAPVGTRMVHATADYVLQGQVDNGGTWPFFLYRLASEGSDRRVEQRVGGNVATGFDSNAVTAGALTRIGIGAVCHAEPTCPRRSGLYSRLSNITLAMEDTIAPETPVTGGPALNGWVNGTKSLDFTVSDSGAGVYVGATTVNGIPVDLETYCTPATDGTGAARQMKPCPASGAGSSSLDTTAAAFNQGNNTVRVCAYEYGHDALQRGCKDDTVKVDSIAPAAPNGLSVRGGEDWRRDNGFILEFDGQEVGDDVSPIVGASVRITGPGGYDQTEYYPGEKLDTIYDVEVPGKGDYTAQVFFRDAAGNESVANSSSVHLRFDDTVPVGKDPSRANGWINREELTSGYMQGWAATSPGETPVSGVAGYRVIVNTNSDTDPCSGADDPRACGGPITEQGQGNLSRVLGHGDLQEGKNYVHVVPISGSGMRATDVRHTPLNADFTDPEAQIQGDNGGAWINHNADLTVSATDALSGMEDTAEFPFDEPPTVVLDVDGAETSGTQDAEATVTGEGVHHVTWCARDLAGNGDCPESAITSADADSAGGSDSDAFAPGHTAIVRIDKTAPAAAFTNQQDPDDPDKLMASVNDALSGVSRGEISYRVAGGTSWKALETSLDGNQLLARVDSHDLIPGTTYEFRVESVDRAGNISISTTKQDGEPMRVTGPFRTLTTVVDLKVNGKANSRIKYGKKAKVTGRLVTQGDGNAVTNAPVSIVSAYMPGSKKASDTMTVNTDEQGSFTAVLPKGPSRSVSVKYRGDQRYMDASSGSAKLAVRSKVTLNVPKQADSDEGIAFSGKVKAKGATLGRRGKRLAIQVQVGRKWKTVGNVLRSNAKGAYTLPYRFTAHYTRAVTYTFRAVVLREGGFPYLPSKSKKRVVTVTP